MILARNSGSLRHFTTSFRANVVVAKTRYQILKVLSFCDRGSAYAPSLKIAVLFFLVENGKMKLSGKSTFEGDAKTLQVESRTGSHPRPRI